MKKILSILIFVSLFCISRNSYAVVLFDGNYYDLIQESTTWDNAKTAAENLTYLGIPGHLATITSSAENAFLNTTFNTGQDSQFAWIGGWEPADDGVWRWAVGPEAGIQFSNGVAPTPPFNYANWGGIEPNDHKPFEDFAMFNIGNTFAGSIAPGQWADASPTPSAFDPVTGYLVEYESAGQTTAIPEPATILLLSLGLFGLPFVRRRS